MGESMTTIVTTAVYPPIPTRDHDWSAHFDWDDGDQAMIGNGETESDAVISLLIAATEADDDGSAIEEVIEMALQGWKALEEKNATLKEGTVT